MVTCWFHGTWLDVLAWSLTHSFGGVLELFYVGEGGGSLPASSWAPRGLGFCQEDWPLAGPLPIASGSLGLSPFGLG